ncbi:MAG: DegV family protein [Lachnospiraceae bacterium]|nr:DegV family protein [Lachnospiraceae bacterium]
MNEQRTAIIMDSGGDIPKNVCEENDIRILPLHVIYPEKDYQDGIDIDPKMVYERFPDEYPSTSTPSVAEVTDLFDALKAEGYEKVIAVCISSGLSGTFNTIRLAAEDYEGLQIYVFDTKNISFGSGIYAYWCAKELQKGTSYEELVRRLPEKLGDSKVLFYMDTLTYLQKGGRIGKVASMLGSALKLKPIISCDENGTYYTVAKIRGARLGKLKLFEEVVKYAFGHRVWLIVGHGNVPEEAEAMREILEKDLIHKTVLFAHQITATLAINTGPGLVGVMVFREP